jgi:ClpP class serine protease
VFTVHEDISKALENEGVKVSMISAGKFKTEGNPYEPLSEEARAAIHESVNDGYEKFVNAIARNRNVKAADVRYGFGEGRVVSAEQAVSLGMADRVGTLDETVSRYFQNLPSVQEPSSPARAETTREAQSLRERVETILKKE